MIKQDKMAMFLAMRDIFYGGEFAAWLDKQEMPFAAMKEYEEAYDFFCQETGFKAVNAENDNCAEEPWEDERDTMQDLTCVPDIIA